MASTRRQKTTGTTWRNVSPSPLILVHGSEDYILTQHIQSVKGQLRASGPDVEVQQLSDADYPPDELQLMASPSLFGDKQRLVFEDMHKMTDAFVTEAQEYVQQVNQDVTSL